MEDNVFAMQSTLYQQQSQRWSHASGYVERERAGAAGREPRPKNDGAASAAIDADAVGNHDIFWTWAQLFE